MLTSMGSRSRRSRKEARTGLTGGERGRGGEGVELIRFVGRRLLADEAGGAAPLLRLLHHPHEPAADLAAQPAELRVRFLPDIAAFARHVEPGGDLFSLTVSVGELADEVPLVPPLRPRLCDVGSNRAGRPPYLIRQPYLTRQRVPFCLRPRLRQLEYALPKRDGPLVHPQVSEGSDRHLALSLSPSLPFPLSQ